MKKERLKVIIVLVIVLISVWNFGLNETKILFANFFELEALAEWESYCKNGAKNTGSCKSNPHPETGKSCKAKSWYESADCYGTGVEDVK
jgi:hypothetical protein